MAITKLNRYSLPTTLDLSAKTLTLPSASVTAHVTQTDLQPIKSDISALALREATNESSAAFNLPNQFIDTFATDTIGTKTTVIVSDGQVSSKSTATAQATVTKYGSPYHTTSQAKFGSSSISTADDANHYLHWDLGATAGDFGTGNWTVEFWYRYGASPTWLPTFAIMPRSDLGTGDGYMDLHTSSNANEMYFRIEGANITNHTGNTNPANEDYSTNTWYHLAFARNGSNHTMWKDGTEVGTFDIGSGALWNMRYGWIGKLAGFTSYWDDFRISNTARYTNGSNFTAPSARFTSDANTRFLLQSINQSNSSGTFVDTGYESTVVNATGTAIQAANAVGSAKTKVGGTMLYKDNEGTATLGTDLKIYFTCDGGSNWTEATSYSAITPVYSTGIKQVRLGETTCTSGTDIRYKAVWANQAAGSKETQLHGIGVNY